jgi:hypothetical protein
MTRGELIEKMARALDPDVWDDPIPCPTRADVVSFHSRRQASCAQADRALTALEAATAPMIRKQERERCAKVADDWRSHAFQLHLTPGNSDLAMQNYCGNMAAAERIAAAIRSMGDAK